MKRLRRLLELTCGERRLLLRAWITLISVRWQLLRRNNSLPGQLFVAQTPDPRLRSTPPLLIAWAVRHASAWVPGTKCLAQALTLHRLLLRSGYPSTLKIGVHKPGPGTLEAHAWVEIEGEGPLLTSTATLPRYTELLAVNQQPKW